MPSSRRRGTALTPDCGASSAGSRHSPRPSGSSGTDWSQPWEAVMNTIVAGYDGSPDSGNAVHWAAAEARARDATLIVCSAWDPVLLGDSSAREHGAEILRRGLGCAQALLGAARVESVLIHGTPVSALREVGAAAE